MARTKKRKLSRFEEVTGRNAAKKRAAKKSSKKAVKNKTASASLLASRAPAVDLTTDSSQGETKPLVPKIEYSPNAMAKCQACRKKIQAKAVRYGIPEFSPRYSKEIYRYYHQKCCPEPLKTRVPNATKQLLKQKLEAANKQQVVGERQELRSMLSDLRSAFARRLQVQPFMVLHNSTVDEIVYKLPTSLSELQKVNGIGSVKLQSFGDPIIQLVRYYQSDVAIQQSKNETRNRVKSERKTRRKPTSKKAAAIFNVVVLDNSDDEEEDDEVAIGESMSCDELVRLKFEHAEAHGYVISID